MEPPAPAPDVSAPPSSSAPAHKAPATTAAPIVLTLPPLNSASTKITPDVITQINIFLWQKESIGKLKSEPSQGGLAWYQDVLTLSEPYVPSHPDDKWWIASVIAEVQRSIAAPHALTVLLTGRTESYMGLISGLLHRKGLCFDYALLKPLGNLRTFDFKRAAIHKLLATYPKTAELHIYEDREEHGERFRELISGLGSAIKGVVHMVADNDTVLPREQELDLVRLLLGRYGTGVLEMHEVTEYSCVLLDSASHGKLRTLFACPQGWHYRAHHLTLNLGPLSPAAGAAAGAQVSLRVVGVGRSERAFAVKCESPMVRSANAIPHITIAFAEGASAKDSNDIAEWREATEGEKVELHGTVTEMKKWALTPVKRVAAKPPPGVNIGAIIRTVHPTISGRAIGEMVVQVKAWLRERESADEAAISAFVKTLPLAAAPAASGTADAGATATTAASATEPQHDKSVPPSAP